jgi:predicted enzyme related to lactoylglutathione lyase
VSDERPPAEGVNVGGFLREAPPELDPSPDGIVGAAPEFAPNVPARVSFVTLAVRDFARMAKFYRQFGWPESEDSNDDFVAFQTGGAILGLYPAKYYASLGDAPAPGSFKGFELAMNLDGADHVDRVYSALKSFEGARFLSEPHDLSIGGRAFSFVDPENNAWEVIWKIGTSFDERGGLIFP